MINQVLQETLCIFEIERGSEKEINGVNIRMKEYLNGGGDGVADNVGGNLGCANGDGRDSRSSVQFEESNFSRHFLGECLHNPKANYSWKGIKMRNGEWIAHGITYKWKWRRKLTANEDELSIIGKTSAIHRNNVNFHLQEFYQI